MKKFIEEFKAFINKGNVLGLAVGVIVGGAFSTITTSLGSMLRYRELTSCQHVDNRIFATRGLLLIPVVTPGIRDFSTRF